MKRPKALFLVGAVFLALTSARAARAAWVLSTDTGSEKIYGITSPDGAEVWAVTGSDSSAGNPGEIFHFDGSAWTLETAAYAVQSGTHRDVFAYDSSHVWAVGNRNGPSYGRVYFSDGSGWFFQTETLGCNYLFGVYATSASAVWASGNGGKIFRSIDGGATWSLSTTSGSATWSKLDGLDSSHVWAVGGTSPTKVLFFDGSSWTLQTSIAWSSATGLRDVSAVSEDDVWASADGGVVLHYDGEWTVATTLGGIGSGFSPIAARDAGRIWTAPYLNSGRIFAYDGSSWSLETDSTYDVYSLEARPAERVWAGENYGQIWRREEPSPSPSPSPTPENYVCELGLAYASYLGGSEEDWGEAIAVDSSYYFYVAGYTSSLNFPTRNAFAASFCQGTEDCFLSGFATSGSALVFSTYFGGQGQDDAYGVAAGDGAVCVTGRTDSADFPTANSYQATFGGGKYDGFAAAFRDSGSALLYSTYLGGGDEENGRGVVARAGAAYVAGDTKSEDFPTTPAAYQSSLGYSGGVDAFAAKLSSDGSLRFSTYLGGTNTDRAYGIAADSLGAAYLTGWTNSWSFPTVNPFQASLQGGSVSDSFVAKLSSAGSRLVYSSYLGGSGSDEGYGIAVDSSLRVCLGGCTFSADFPTLSCFQAQTAGPVSAFVTRVSSSGSCLLYSTYLGGRGDTRAYALAVDDVGSASVVGFTQADDFPTRSAYQPSRAGSNDIFISRLAPSGSALAFSSYLGSTSSDTGRGVALDLSGAVYIAGYTSSSAFPLVDPYQATYGGGAYDALVAKLALACYATSPTAPPTATATATPIPSATPTPTPLRTPTPLPRTPTPSPTATPSPRITPSPRPPTPTPRPSATPLPPTPTPPAPTPSGSVSATPSPSPTPCGPLLVSGRVVDRLTGAALPGAAVMVSVSDAESPVVSSGLAGAFAASVSCTSFAEGTLRASARLRDYLPGAAEQAYAGWGAVTGVFVELLPARSVPGVVRGDYGGGGTDAIAVFRPASSLWAVRDLTRLYFGSSGDDLVPADYDGDGASDAAVFRGTTGLWAIGALTRIYLGALSDVAAPGDYDGDGTDDPAVFRQSNQLWAVHSLTRVYFGDVDDQAVCADYDGDGTAEIAVFRGSSSLWAIRDVSRVYFGSSDDRLVPGDYAGSGSFRAAVFRSSSSLWAVLDLTRVYLGASGDYPVPADYDGSGTDRTGVFRPSAGLWALSDLTRAYFGATGDVPVTR